MPHTILNLFVVMPLCRMTLTMIDQQTVKTPFARDVSHTTRSTVVWLQNVTDKLLRVLICTSHTTRRGN